MSAWIVPKEHLDAMVWAFLEYRPEGMTLGELLGRDDLGRLLLDTCVESVACRTPGSRWTGRSN